jgi:putative oxidoreductase
MQIFKILFCILGRMFLSAIFIIAALNKLLNWSSAKEGYLEVLAKWHLATDNIVVERIFDLMAQQANFFLVAATALELIGGLLVLVGIFSRLGAYLLIVFLIPVTVIYHAFWILSSSERDIQLVMFMKNIAILGGLMIIAVFGSGITFTKSQQAP